MAQEKGRSASALRKALSELSQEELQTLLSPKYRVISTDEWKALVSSLQVGALASACARGVIDSQSRNELALILRGIRDGMSVLEKRLESLE
jgi:hypothetical protein